MVFRHRAAILAVLATATFSASFADQGPYPNAGAITPARLKAHLEFIASDEMEGRDTPSRGLDIAALYVETELKLWGLKPMGDDGGYLQRYGVIKPTVDAAATTLDFAGKPRTYGADFYAMSTDGGSAEGPMVFVGDGYVVPRLGLDPYQKIDVKGKVVVVNGARPKGITRQDRAGGMLDAFAAAAKNGALGVVVVPNNDSMDFFASRAAASTKVGLPRVEFQAQTSSVPVVVASKDLATEIFAGEKEDYEQILKGADTGETTPFALVASKTIKFHTAVDMQREMAENVVAMVPGSDPKLSAEFVAMSAHLDHLGVRNGKIYNGADDDGSGTVSILELAHAFATGARPKRSMLFIWHSGEEKGLWGSSYYSGHPTIDLKKMVTDLNIDMIGRSKAPGDTKKANAVLTGPNEIYVVGSYMLSKELGDRCKQVNDKMYKLALNYKYDDPKDTERIYYRSDHYNYASKGIPIAFFFDGVHEDYHQPTDKVAKIDFEKMSKVARTVYGIAWTIGNDRKRLPVDVKAGS